VGDLSPAQHHRNTAVNDQLLLAASHFFYLPISPQLIPPEQGREDDEANRAAVAPDTSSPS